MNTRERRRALLNELQQKKRVYIAELAEQFDVTTMTVRRDLKRLEDEKIVTLVHGGAIYNEGGISIAGVSARRGVMSEAKQDLATYCANMVQEGNAIYLDAGSTTMSIANSLIDRKNIAVLTNSLSVMNILSHSPGIQLIALTGMYDVTTRGFFGELTCRALRGFRIDLAFIGIYGMSLADGLMAQWADDQALKKTLLEVSRKSIVVTDHTKIGKSALFRVDGLENVDAIVTDKQADKEFVAGARKLGVEVVQV